MRTRSSTGTALRAAIVPWPSRAHLRAEAAADGRPCLLVVDAGAELPVAGELEDWVRADAGEADVAARLADLEAFARDRAPGPRPVVEVPEGLAAADRRVARTLLARAGSLVPVEDLVDVGVGLGVGHDLDAAIVRVRAALAGTPWRIERVASRGFIALAQDHRS